MSAFLSYPDFNTHIFKHCVIFSDKKVTGHQSPKMPVAYDCTVPTYFNLLATVLLVCKFSYDKSYSTAEHIISYNFGKCSAGAEFFIFSSY